MAHGHAVVFARPRRSVATSPGQYPVSNGRRPRIASRATHPARPETRRGPAALPSTANAVKQLLMFARRTNALAQSRPCITSVGDRCLRVLAAGEPRDVNAQDCDRPVAVDPCGSFRCEAGGHPAGPSWSGRPRTARYSVTLPSWPDASSSQHCHPQSSGRRGSTLSTWVSRGTEKRLQ
jgi:hypothetical protein